MLGLHNIFLISPPPQQQNPPNINNNIQQADYSNDDHNNPWNLNNKAHELGLIKNDTVFGVCRDCGNRAKKECGFRRCRTCCKTRSYDCVTHVKSTWVPASTRREKKVGDAGAGSSGGSSSCGGGAKRQRLGDGSYFTCTSNANAKGLNFDSASYHQDAGFKKTLPSQVSTPADFRCIRVTAISNEETEVAYQATVNISGHVFKGFLYNKGIDEKNLFPKVPIESGTRRDSSSPIVNLTQTLAVGSND